MPNSSKKIFQKMPKICNMYVSRVPIMSTNTYTITLDILTKPCAHLKKLIIKKTFFNKFSIILADVSCFFRQSSAHINLVFIGFSDLKSKKDLQAPLP